MTPQSSKKTLAGDVWRLMMEAAMAQFGRSSSILHPLGLTPGHLKLMLQLEDTGKTDK